MADSSGMVDLFQRVPFHMWRELNEGCLVFIKFDSNY